MFDHVTIRVSDREASEEFYAHVLATLAIARTFTGPELAEWNDFSLAAATGDRPVTRRLHIAFVAPSRDEVDALWRAGVDAGYRDDGAPGPRPQYSEDYYGAFLLDPDGNSAEAVHHGDTRNRSGNVDHLWIGVADRAAAQRFWKTIAPYLGVRVKVTRPDRTHVASDTGSFALVADGRSPTENVHVAFPARDNAAVDDFHRAATAAGYRDNGAPGERPEYHAGYYGAYVLDPDGNNVELVCHNR